MLNLKVKPLGAWQANCYLLTNPRTNRAVLVDPGDEADAVLGWIGGVKVLQVLLTHGDPDHVGALDAVCSALEVPFGIHPADAAHFKVTGGHDLSAGVRVALDEHDLEVVHIPGHTPGSVAFRIVENGVFQRALVGDTIFPGGPGHTKTPADLARSLASLASTVFTWPDEITLYPGHGNPTTVGDERAAFEAFHAGPLPPDLCGDVSWR